MATFNIKQIMLDYHLEERETASVLFKENRYPELALRRALELQTNFTVKQVSDLADYLGVPIYALFTDNGWYYAPSELGMAVLQKGDATALICGNEIILRSKLTGTERYIVTPERITLKDLTQMLDEALAADML